jgi:acetyltransferase-like isoleucine patch superfamily enzyme
MSLPAIAVLWLPWQKSGRGCRLGSHGWVPASTATWGERVSFAWRLRKKILKRWARNAFFPSMRVSLLRLCGFSIGKDVYIADDLIIVEELADRGNLSIGDRVSIAPRVTLVTSSHPNHSRTRGFAPVSQGPIVIEADAWLGAGR